MVIRSDHVAGAFFVAVGVLVFALSGDLPFGTLSFPGSGFLPKIIATLMIVFGLTLALQARGSETFASLRWEDLRHALPVTLATALAIFAYERLGFALTVFLLLLGLTFGLERKNVLAAAAYSAVVTTVAYVLFEKLLKTPLPHGPFGF